MFVRIFNCFLVLLLHFCFSRGWWPRIPHNYRFSVLSHENESGAKLERETPLTCVARSCVLLVVLVWENIGSFSGFQIGFRENIGSFSWSSAFKRLRAFILDFVSFDHFQPGIRRICYCMNINIYLVWNFELKIVVGFGLHFEGV